MRIRDREFLIIHDTAERRCRKINWLFKVNELLQVSGSTNGEEVVVYQRAVVTDQMRTFNPPPMNDLEPECFNDWSKFKFTGSVQD
jgi:hypothetical protein